MLTARQRHFYTYQCICSLLYRVVQKKFVQSLMHRHFATVYSRIARFSPKCSVKIIKTAQTEKADLLKMTVEFPARLWKWHMLFTVLQIIESTSVAKRLSGSDRRRSE